MKYVQIPGTELHVSQLCLGTAEIGAQLSIPDALLLLDEYVRLGGSFIDTAHVYSDWIRGTKSTSEKTIGQWLKANGVRNQVMIGTKGGHPALSSMHVSRLSRAEIELDLAESREYLQTDVIDLYWLHRDDPAIPVAEIIDILNEQVAAGRIRCFGASNWTVARIRAANEYALRQRVQGFAANQPMWSLAAVNADALPDKTTVAMDADTLDYHRRTGLTAIPFSSQAHGFFDKLHNLGHSGVPSSDLRVYGSPANTARLARVEALAQKYSVSVNDIALAYLLSQPFVTIPIIGCKRVEHLRESMSAIELRLTPEELDYLEHVS